MSDALENIGKLNSYKEALKDVDRTVLKLVLDLELTRAVQAHLALKVKQHERNVKPVPVEQTKPLPEVGGGKTT